jgi:hypothetical protein
MNGDVIYQGIEAFNKDVQAWAYKVRSTLKSNIQSSAGKGKGELSRSLKSNLRKDHGEIDSISYKFPRHGVFFQKGVGRGHIMQGGKVVRGVKSKKVVRFLDGPVKRSPQDWFNRTLENELPKLADIVANHKANEAVVRTAGMKKR